MCPDRVGPPAPRNEPWCPPPLEQAADAAQPQRDPLPDTPEQGAVRTRECQEWIARCFGGDQLSARERLVAELAFCAGWSARKHAQYRAILNHLGG